MNTLPEIVSSLTGHIRWGIFFIIVLFFFYRFKFFFHKVNRSFLLIFFFYFIQMLYAVGTHSDIIRYVGLTVMALTIPFFIAHTIAKSSAFLFPRIIIIVYSLILFSVLFNIEMIASGFRFYGFANNPNLYGMTALFWLAILLLPNVQEKAAPLINNIFLCLLIITILLSGSRSALLGVIIILIFRFRTNIKALIILLILVLITGYSLISLLNLEFITDRLLNIGDSIEDSGRVYVWNKAFEFINRNPIWGNGMNANLTLVGTGNIHNCYIRYLLNMGIVFTTVSFSFYIGYLVMLLKRFKDIPAPLIGFLIAFTIGNFGEDYFVGIGSSIFIYFTFVIGLVTYYLTVKEKVSR